MNIFFCVVRLSLINCYFDFQSMSPRLSYFSHFIGPVAKKVLPLVKIQCSDVICISSHKDQCKKSGRKLIFTVFWLSELLTDLALTIVLYSVSSKTVPQSINS